MKLRSAGRISGLQIHQTSGNGQETQIQTAAAMPCYWPKTTTCVALLTSHVWPTEHKTKQYAVKGDELQRTWKEAFPAYCSTLNIETRLNMKRNPFLRPRKHAAPHFMEPEGSVPRLQQPSTCPYLEPREFSVRRPILLTNSILSFHPFLFVPRSPFPLRPHEGLVSSTLTSSTTDTTSTGRTDRHHSNTQQTHCTFYRCRSSRQHTPHCATDDVTCSYRPIASDSHRV